MLLAGIQAEFRLDPRLKHSGVTVFRHIQLSVISKRERMREDQNLFLENFVQFVSFVMKVI